MSILIPLFLSGFFGSLGHCLGMCGPLNTMVSLQVRKNELSLPKSFILYHGARVTVYAVLGGIIGLLGSLLGISRQLTFLSGTVSLLLGLTILLLGCGYLGWFRVFNLEGQASWWNVALSAALKKKGHFGVLILGALNGLLPCGLVYSALLLAATGGGPAIGALGMTLFGLGTFPALVIVDLTAGTLNVRVRRFMLHLAGGLMLAVGLQLVLRGGAILQLWGHLHWKGIALW